MSVKEFKITVDMYKGCPHQFEQTNHKCRWTTPGDENHTKDVFMVPLFGGRLKGKGKEDGKKNYIPICANHLSDHRVMMSLHKAGLGKIKDLLELTAEERELMLFGDKVPLISWENI